MRIRLRTQAPPRTTPPPILQDRDQLAPYLEDASGFGPAWTPGLLRPQEEEEISAFLAHTLRFPVPGSEVIPVPVLPQAGRTSLTGGAVPQGEVVLSLERMNAIGRLEQIGPREARLSVDPGVRLRPLLAHLAERGWYYPPVPTYAEACIGGTAATNAGGAATFKYGSTRDWIEALRVVLYNGDVLELWRGQAVVDRHTEVEIALSDGSSLRLPIPSYRTPPLKKISAGYYAAEPLDLVDLFIGSEGTLGVITRLVLRLIPLPPAVLTGLIFTRSVSEALRLAGALRDLAHRSRSGAPGADVRAIEFLDEAALQLILPRARELRIEVPPWARAVLLLEAELPEALRLEDLAERYALWTEGQLPDGDPLGALWGAIASFGLPLEAADWALPDDPRRQTELMAFREAAPRMVNELLSRFRARDPGVRKTGGDIIVPVEELEACYAASREAFLRRGVDVAIWGHVSDGNLHPNGLPRTSQETRAGQEALLELGDWVRTRGGCPLSEHGVGRNPVKQELLRRFWGPEALGQMWALKGALDPSGRLAPGVLLPLSPSHRRAPEHL